MRVVKYILPLLLASLLSSCAKEDIQREITVDASVQSTVQVSKATLIGSSDINSYRLHIEGYTAGKVANYLNSNALYENGKWAFFKGNFKDYKYYWPDYSLDFLAYAPYQLENTRCTMQPYAASAPSFSYSGVSPVTAASQTDSQLSEFVCAFKPGCTYDSDNPVVFSLHHPFALVSFRLNESIRCTILSVKITGIKNNGVCTLTGTSPYASWAASGDDTQVLVDFEHDPEYSAKGGIRFPEDVNNYSHLAGPFLVVPQTFGADAMLEVEYLALGGTRTTVAKSYLNKAVISETSQLAASWVPGNSYAYGLTLNGAANELFVAVQVAEWNVQGTVDVEVK